MCIRSNPFLLHLYFRKYFLGGLGSQLWGRGALLPPSMYICFVIILKIIAFFCSLLGFDRKCLFCGLSLWVFRFHFYNTVEYVEDQEAIRGWKTKIALWWQASGLPLLQQNYWFLLILLHLEFEMLLLLLLPRVNPKEKQISVDRFTFG